MPDFDAITVALAARFAPGAVTPPTGYDNIRVSTGSLPNQMVPLPAVLVFPEGGEFIDRKRDSNNEFVVRFYYNQTGDLERDTVALRKWLSVLVDRLIESLKLGGVSWATATVVGEVTTAVITGYTVGVFPYAGLDYTGIELTVRVVVNENVAWVA